MPYLRVAYMGIHDEMDQAPLGTIVYSIRSTQGDAQECAKGCSSRREMMKGQLDKHCPKCGQAYAWEKVTFMRHDGYPDWRLYVSCRCKQAAGPEVLALARKDYDRVLRDRIVAEQNRALDRFLGRRLHRYLDRIVQNHNPNRVIPYVRERRAHGA
jgi:hypothetical protein